MTMNKNKTRLQLSEDNYKIELARRLTKQSRIRKKNQYGLDLDYNTDLSTANISTFLEEIRIEHTLKQTVMHK